jgi:hypothetical protein
MEQETYLVRVVRPVFQVAYLEVEAQSEAQACGAALQSATTLPDDQWAGRFNPEDHVFDVHCVRESETPGGHPFSLIDFPLYSILSSGESPYLQCNGVQPWMNYLNPLTVAGYLSQWIEELTEARDGFYGESIEKFEEMLRDIRGTDQKVVPLLPPEEVRVRVEYLESLLNLLSLLKDVD